MSKIVHYKGRLIKVEMDGDLENTARGILEGMDVELIKDYHDTCLEQLEDQYHKDYITINGAIYKAEYEEIESDEEIYNAIGAPAGGFNFEVKYYDGGCVFSEAVEMAVNKYLDRVEITRAKWLSAIT